MTEFVKRPWNLVDTKQDFLIEKLYNAVIELRNELDELKKGSSDDTTEEHPVTELEQKIIDLETTVESLVSQYKTLKERVDKLDKKTIVITDGLVKVTDAIDKFDKTEAQPSEQYPGTVDPGITI